MISFLLLLMPLVWLMVYRFQRRKMYKCAAKFQSPIEELPIIGLTHTVTGDTKDIMQTLKHFSYVALNSQGIMKAWLGHILYFLMTDPRDLEYVLKTCMEKDDLHRFLRVVIGYGGIFAPVKIWRRRRKVMIPAFSPKIVETFVPVFSEQSMKLNNCLRKIADGKEFPIWPYLTCYTLDAVSETAMGIKVNSQDDHNVPFLMSINSLLNIVCERIFHLWLQPDWLYKLFPQYREQEKLVKITHDFTDKVIKKKRIDLKEELQGKTEADTQYDLQTYTRKPFLDYLIAFSGGDTGYSDEELREEVLTLTVAGTDTSAVAMGFTLILMGKYPDIQERVFQELYEIYGDSDRPLVKEDLEKMKFLERVVKESLRLFPPVPFIIRKVEENITLPSGRELPAGSGVAVSIWGVHRDPKYWGPQAEHFDPDRWMPERLNIPYPCCYMPFSQGPRNCVGYQYALMSIKTSVANILREFKVIGEPEKGPIPHIPVKIDVMMKAVDGYRLALQRRKTATTAA